MLLLLSVHSLINPTLDRKPAHDNDDGDDDGDDEDDDDNDNDEAEGNIRNHFGCCSPTGRGWFPL